MGSPKTTRKYVKEELPYKLLIQMYENSRYSLKKFAKNVGVTYHTVSKTLKALESKHKLVYTLELNEDALGFSEGKLITIKFQQRPHIDVIRSFFANDLNVQDAYMATGDFDILLYVVGLSPKDFQYWQFNLRTKLSRYKPLVRFSNVNAYSIGFFPLRNVLIKESAILSDLEKKILIALNENSRAKLKDLCELCKATQMRVIYTLKKLKEKGIIKRFATLTQNTDKKIVLAYGVFLAPVEGHKKLLIKFAKNLVKEDLHEITNDYCLDISTNGVYDDFFICTLKSGEDIDRRGSALIQKLWVEENPRIKQALLTEILFGKWPFHLENYKNHLKVIETEDYSV